ncbi:ABC transporter permease [Hujiaoplasma nucleasis]|uniref:ABC transporter permease n=1 Tax=Hujiaoplasma nucleasis TaxID=2725268 RepID=A0A7L6N663_9MOLU|nr:ABC transporter permease [Hujiaoplasma nucleasis]QLY40757.1 ABC transporter permease [Hujiaoplasma nucleasis]
MNKTYENLVSFLKKAKDKTKVYYKKLRSNDSFNAITGAILAIFIGLLFGVILMVIINPDNAREGISRLFKGYLNDPRGGSIGFAKMLTSATPIIFTGLAVAFAFKTGLFNIGASGQYTVGLFAAALVGILGDKLNSFQWIVAVLAGMASGFIWGAIPGIFKAKYNVHEVITSIMFNYVAMYVVNGLLNSDYLKTKVINGTTNRTIAVDQNARTSYGFFDTMFPNSGLDISIFIALGTAILIYFILNKTVFGRELKSVGLNRDAAKYAGVNEKKSIILSMAISGMLAGLGGALFILGPSVYNLGNVYAVENVIAGAGFDGIPVALLASSNPIGVIFSTMFVAYIEIAGGPMQSVGFVKEIVDIIIAVILYFSAFALIMTQNLDKIGTIFKKVKFKKKKKDDINHLETKAGEN